MIKKTLIIGSGSIAKKHKKVLHEINKNIKLLLVPTRKFNKYKPKDFNRLINFNADYILICSPSTYHYKHFQLIEKYFKKKTVLIEKPLFSSYRKLKRTFKNKKTPALF